MDSQKQQAAERIKEANNILVTVSSNPSVDQLAACIGLTLSLNKMGKHATAVFSGGIPSTIEFLQPEKTLEKNTDSLRDFIIALDKSKADKLRYKVEDKVVKIFITPYKTSISEKDLEFSQGDFNVDVVLALGVHSQADLDQAITSHGRILHDATVVTMNVRPGGELGSINWLDPNASSLSELGAGLLDQLDKKLMDGQIATALLTGIVAETERFSNAKTSPQTMSISAELMAAGANQQLVATKLEAPAPPAQPAPIPQETENKEGQEQAPPKPDDGTLEISHEEKQNQGQEAQQQPAEEQQHEGAPAPVAAPEAEEPVPASPVEQEQKQEQQQPEAEKPEEQPKPPMPLLPPAPPVSGYNETVAPQIHIDEHGAMMPLEDMLPPKLGEPPAISHHSEPPKMIIQPPALGGAMSATGGPDFGEQPSGAGQGMPLVSQPDLSSAPSLTMPGGPVGHTIMPPVETSVHTDEEAPSGGPVQSDSYLVGSGSMPVIPPLPPSPNPGFPGPQPVATASSMPPLPAAPSLPETNADAGRTLSDIEKDVHSLHAETSTSTDVLPPAQLPTQDGQSPVPSAEAPVVGADVNSARDAVAQAINGAPAQALDAAQSQNTQASPAEVAPAPPAPPATPVQPWTPPTEDPAPANTQFNPAAMNIQTDSDPDAPPAVPPPMLPPTNPY